MAKRTSERSDTLSTGEAAKLLTQELGATKQGCAHTAQSVRRLASRGEISFVWSRSEVSRGALGHEFRGHRRITRTSVEAYVKRQREQRKQASVGEAGASVVADLGLDEPGL